MKQFRKGDLAYIEHGSGRFLTPVEIVRVIRHKGEPHFVVEIRAEPDVILGIRPGGAIWRRPDRSA